jgi:hypothetical protein
MTTVFDNEYRCASFTNTVNGVRISGDLKINKENQLEYFNGTFYADEQMVGSVNSFMDGPMDGEKEMKLNYNSIDMDYHMDIFTLVKSVLGDIEKDFLGVNTEKI